MTTAVPCLQNTSPATLGDVIAFYAPGGNSNPNPDPVMARRPLTRRDREDLVAFLRTLTTTWLRDSTAVMARLLPQVPAKALVEQQ